MPIKKKQKDGSLKLANVQPALEGVFVSRAPEDGCEPSMWQTLFHAPCLHATIWNVNTVGFRYNTILLTAIRT
jgi:hypothetical protein